jgi:Tol biopolymer transport system component
LRPLDSLNAISSRKRDKIADNAYRHLDYHVLRVSLRSLKLLLCVICLAACQQSRLPSGNPESSFIDLAHLQVPEGRVVDNPIFSPDGKQLAYVSMTDKPDSLKLYSLENDTFNTILPYLPYYYLYAWRDDVHVTYVVNGELKSIDLNTRATTMIWPNTEAWVSYVFNPTNDNIIIVEKHSPGSIGEYRPSELYRIDLLTGHEEQLTFTKDVSEENPVISADGKLVAYFTVTGLVLRPGGRDTPGHTEIVVRSMDTAALTVYQAEAIAQDRLLALTPSSDGIIFFVPHGREHVSGIYMLEFDRPTLSTLLIPYTSLSRGIGGFTWSPTNKRIALNTVGVPRSNELLVSEPITAEKLVLIRQARSTDQRAEASPSNLGQREMVHN